MFIIDDLLLAPARGLLFIFKEIQKRVEQELYDEAQIMKQLVRLQMEYELGEIPEREFKDQEAELLAKLREVRERKALGED